MRRFAPILIGLAALAALVFGVAGADATAPAVTVEPATAVHYTTAQVSGEVDPGGEPTTWRFQYATQAQFEASEWAEAATGPEGTLEGAGLQPVGGELTGLAPGTTYHLRLFAENGGGPAEAVAPTFETEAVALPTVTLEAPVPLGPTTAHLVGHIDPNAPAGPLSPAAEAAFAVAWHFQCSPECPGLEGTLAASSTSEEVSAEATGLVPGASYEVSLVATNAGGTETAGPLASSSPAAGPSIGETFATEVLSTEAKLGAQIDPGGAPTTFHFQYATNEAFTTGVGAAPESGSIGSGNSPVGVSARIAGLTPGTAYFYRAIATNPAAPGGVVGRTARIATPAAPMGPFELPDDRGYEMVSPLDKGNAEIANDFGLSSGGAIQAAADGDAIAYVSVGSFADPQGNPLGSQYLSRRDAPAADWSTENLTTRSGTRPVTVSGTQYKAFSPDLSQGLVASNVFGFENNPGAEIEGPPLSPEAPPGYENLFLRDSATGLFDSLVKEAPAVTPEQFYPQLEGASPDLEHVVLGIGTRPTVFTEDLYEWNRGERVLQPVDVLPGESQAAHCGPQCGLLGGNIGRNTERAVSADGSRVFWTYQRTGLYVRIDGRETLQLDASQNPAEPEGGKGSYWTASSDGTRAFFTDGRPLTPGSTATTGNHGVETREDLYECRLVESGGQTHCELTDLTTQDPAGAGVLGVLGSSDDGSYVYFVANGVLAANAGMGGAHASPGGCESTPREEASLCNLYVAHDGAVRFIAVLSQEDEVFGSSGLGINYQANDWAQISAARTARVSADGSRLLFMSQRPLTGNDNRGQECIPVTHAGVTRYEPGPCQEVYLYDATADSGRGRLACVSCNPSGARPVGPSRIPPPKSFVRQKAIYSSRLLSEGAGAGRAFFDSRDALVPTDTNGTEDVYEYEDGAPHLISTGTSPAPSQFLDASENGNDAFFVTQQQLVPGDTDQLPDLYDARVGGGFPSAPQLVCQGEGCREAAGAPPNLAGPPSTAAGGPGNVRPAKKSKCSKGKVRKQNKCVKKAPPKNRHRSNKKHDKAGNGGRTH